MIGLRVVEGARATAFLILAAAPACDAGTTSLGAWLPEASTGFYLEAETGQLSGGFTIVNDQAASAGASIEPPSGVSPADGPGSARARYTFEIATSGVYLIWARIRSPDVPHNSFWMQVDGDRWFVWRITTGEIWYWVPLHENVNYDTPLTFAFEPGTHELVVANSIEGDALDRFFITADGDTPSGNDTPCRPPHSISIDGGCIPSCGSQGGNECGAMACQGHDLLPAYDCAVCCIVR